MRKPPKQEPRKDKCNRRIGFVRQPKGKYILLSTNEYMTLEWMHRHGGYATTPFIHRFNSLMGFTKSKDCRTTSYRFCNLFHEDDTDHGGPYIDWPYQQTHGVNYPDSKYRTHRTSKFAIEALKAAHLYHENTPEASSSHWHDILRSACTQSIAIARSGIPAFVLFISLFGPPRIGLGRSIPGTTSLIKFPVFDCEIMHLDCIATKFQE